MDNSTKQFLIRLASLVAAGLISFYAFALFDGRAVFPIELQSGVVTFLLVVLAVAGPAVAGLISTRASNRNSNINAQETQHMVQAATKQATQQIKDYHENGGGDKLAAKVVAQVEPLIAATPRDPESQDRATDRRS